ncbi:protein kinase APK1B, chloroplastic-like [Brassica rapa]|uniref:non-specific serine/threonine protein kinase n=1 Tax=Brassica campestris TaxID=3711 RepID=B0L048_BRACM|nr:protein kinase APK1B, chloroplastic-like [Brassica rapa]ABP01775.1 MLPK isoform 2 [Brassica rapa]
MGFVKKVQSKVFLYVNYLFGVCIGASPKYMSSEANDTQSMGSKCSSVSVRTSPRTEGEILQSPNLKCFSFAELKAATRNFRLDSVLGEGGFGCVFKGWIDEESLTASKPGTGMVIAVKRLNIEGWQGHQEWLAEVNYLGRLSHPNLVKLIGYCLEDEHHLLVYEFMPCGSLENHLFRRGSYFEPLSWNIRLKIALGCAKGLAFLHSAETQVIYRDFKTSNILLDSNYNAKLSDFGLAKDGPTGDNSHVSTRVIGTYGYVDPGYLLNGHLTTKSDVYSYGVVLLEMLSGRKVVDNNRPPREQKLVDWAKPLLANKKKVSRVIDNRIRDQISVKEAHKVATQVFRCLDVDKNQRPNMNEIVFHLENIQASREEGGNKTEKRMRRRRDSFAQQTGVGGIATAYPRPSASPLFV